MNAVPTASTDNNVLLTRKQKQHLLNQMYFKAHWVELIRLFRHQILPVAEAKAAMEPLVARFGKEPLAIASETMIEIFVKEEASFARLKPHIRRMAFSLIGPEPTPNPEAPKPIPPPKPPAKNHDRRQHLKRPQQSVREAVRKFQNRLRPLESWTNTVRPRSGIPTCFSSFAWATSTNCLTRTRRSLPSCSV